MDRELIVTKNFDFLEELKTDTRYAVLEGATRSTKTYSIIQWLIYQCLTREKIIVRCFRKDGSTHRGTTIKDFLSVMDSYGCFDENAWNKSTSIYTFQNGSEFTFDATNDAQKLQGKKQTIAWLEECMEINYDSFTQIEYRTTDLLLFSFNPSLSSHWVFKKIMKRTNCEYAHSTYKDNPFLTPEQVLAIEAFNPGDPENIRNGTADAYKWAVYGLGQRGKLEGAIYKLFGQTSYDEFPDIKLCSSYGFGLDFGFSNDPTVLIECRIFNGDLYMRELIHETGLITLRNPNNMSVKSLQERLEDLQIPKNCIIVADSAEPKSIHALKSLGYSIIGVKKGPGSVLAGIDTVKRHRMYVDENSMNLIKSLERYSWAKDGQGQTTMKPHHDFSDPCDAFRYYCTHFCKIKVQNPCTEASGPIISRIKNARNGSGNYNSNARKRFFGQ